MTSFPNAERSASTDPPVAAAVQPGPIRAARSAQRAPLRADLRAMMGDGIAFSFMVGIGESYLPAFALALGYGDVTAALVATGPMLAGAVLQLVTPMAVGLLNSHRRWVVLCAALQAVSFVPLVAGALAGGMEVWMLYAAAALYWGLGMSTGPAWNAWATTLVPRRIRPRYFALRSRASQLSLVSALLLGGAVLEFGASRIGAVTVFAPIFLLALLARSLSASMLAAQSESRPVPIGETRISPRDIRGHIAAGGHGRLLVALLAFQLSVWIAAPFFTPFMLGPLGLSYLEFTVLTGAAFVSRVLALPALGRLARRAGTKRVLWVGSIGIVPLPAMWLVSEHFAWLLLLQLIGGVAWAAFELASMLAFFEHIPAHGRTSILTVYNLANALAIVAGASIGSLLVGLLPQAAGGFALLLMLSSGMRLACLPLLRRLSDRAVVDPVPVLRTLTLRPSSGGLQRPVLAALDGQQSESRP